VNGTGTPTIPLRDEAVVHNPLLLLVLVFQAVLIFPLLTVFVLNGEEVPICTDIPVEVLLEAEPTNTC
jgi:hypothetical protein